MQNSALVLKDQVSFQDKLGALRDQISFYEHEVTRHPLATMIQHKKMPTSAEKALAMYLFMDSWMWPSMLISMRDHISHPLLKKAIEDNLQDEVGKRGVSHIKMCIDFVRSLGYSPTIINLAEINRTINVSYDLTQAQIAGWLVGAEMLTLPLYQLALSCFSDKSNVDLLYLNAHVKVDEDHIQWLWGALKALFEENDNIKIGQEISEGIALGARATLKALDEIYEEALADEVTKQCQINN